MLVSEDLKKRILHFGEFLVASSGNGNCLALAWRGVFFDELLDVIIVDVV